MATTQVPTGGPAQGTGLPPAGANLAAPALPGDTPQPANPSKPPGWGPIFQYLYLSFLTKADPNQLFDDRRVEQISRACERAADRACADFQKFGVTLDLPKPKMPGG